MNWDDLTWTCHVCGEERPDNKISVHKKYKEYSNGVEMQINTRYCTIVRRASKVHQQP